MVNCVALNGRGCVIGNFEYYLIAINVQFIIRPHHKSTIEIYVPETMKDNSLNEDMYRLFGENKS
jgi:hypothetical protein